VRFNYEGGKLKSGSGKWRLSGKVGKESRRLELLVDVGATHTGDDLGKSGKETATDHSISSGIINRTAHGKA
jgi:hypothetical protein